MSRYSVRLLRAASLLAAIAVSACSGLGGSAPAEYVCPQDIVDRIAPLVQPANGATGVSTTIGTVTVTSEPGLAGLQVALTPSGGGSLIFGGTFAAVSSSTVAATVPVLSAHTTYTVGVGSPGATPVVPGSDGSCPVMTAWLIGTFTTQ